MPPVALVTGASSGVGEALAPLLARHGYRVYGMSRRRVEVPGVRALPADVGKAAEVTRAIDELIAETGRLDAVIHCAGVGGAGAVETMNLDRAHVLMQTNFWGSLHLCQATLPHLRACPTSKLILLSSVAGHMGIPFRSVYCASKAAVLSLTASLRQELRGAAPGVTCVSPGDIATNSFATQYRQPVEEVPQLYRDRYRRADGGMGDNVEQGMSALHVAEAIHRLLRKDRLAPHYTVARPVQKASVVAKRLLPARWWEWILGRYYT